MVGTLTYTGVLGPGQSVTSMIFNNVHSVKFNHDKEVIEVNYDNPEKTQHLDMRASGTITGTFVAGVSLAITVS